MTHDVDQHLHDVDPPPNTVWTPEMVERISQYAGKFVSREIAEMLMSEFGCTITKSSVIGKLHRLGFCKPRPDRGPRPDLSEAASLREKAKRIRSPRRRSKVSFLPRVIECAPRAVALMDLEPGECRYSVNDSDEACGHLFCGLPSEGSWCAQHTRLVFVPPPKRESNKKQFWRAA